MLEIYNKKITIVYKGETFYISTSEKGIELLNDIIKNNYNIEEIINVN